MNKLHRMHEEEQARMQDEHDREKRKLELWLRKEGKLNE